MIIYCLLNCTILRFCLVLPTLVDLKVRYVIIMYNLLSNTNIHIRASFYLINTKCCKKNLNKLYIILPISGSQSSSVFVLYTETYLGIFAIEFTLKSHVDTKVKKFKFVHTLKIIIISLRLKIKVNTTSTLLLQSYVLKMRRYC